MNMPSLEEMKKVYLDGFDHGSEKDPVDDGIERIHAQVSASYQGEVDEMAMIIRRLVQRINQLSTRQDNTAVMAMDYLNRTGKQGSIIREDSPAVSEVLDEVRFKADLFGALYDGFGFISPDACDKITETAFEILKSKGYLPSSLVMR